jgi:hypothetical protein
MRALGATHHGLSFGDAGERLNFFHLLPPSVKNIHPEILFGFTQNFPILIISVSSSAGLRSVGAEATTALG